MISIALAAALSVTAQAEAAPPVPGLPAGYSLVWADEFETPGAPDPTRWGYDTGRNRDGWYNNELQYYAADRPENARVEDGRLVIEARRERLEGAADFGGQDYTSARLVSAGKGDWTYGFVSVRANLPCGLGSWPAIWMLPSQGGWPLGGEIDIMEHVGHEPTTIYGTTHTARYNHVLKTESGGSIQVPDACGAFHDYQVRWTPQIVEFLVDGTAYHAFNNDGTGERESWPFDHPFHLILNIAVGGDWGGAQGVDPSIFPIRMEVEYARVYQLDQ